MFDTIVKREGKFSFSDGFLYGPSQYMRERGNDLIDRILDNQDVIFLASLPLELGNVDIDMLLLGRMQADYLAWVSVQCTK